MRDGYRNEYNGQQDTMMLVMIVTMETHTPINIAYSPAKLCSNTTNIPAMNTPVEIHTHRERERIANGNSLYCIL